MAAAKSHVCKRWWTSIGVGALACVGLLRGGPTAGRRWLSLAADCCSAARGGWSQSDSRSSRWASSDWSCRRSAPTADAGPAAVGARPVVPIRLVVAISHRRRPPQHLVRSPRVINHGGAFNPVIRAGRGLFVLAAVAEIGGAWLVWQGVREQRDWIWAGLGVIALGIYGFVATLQPDAHFGRILAAYGGVFVAGSLAWGMALDGFRPDRWDVIGALVCLAGVAVIMYASRGH